MVGVGSMLGRIMDRLDDVAGTAQKGPRRGSPKNNTSEPALKKSRLVTLAKQALGGENDGTDESGAEEDAQQQSMGKPKHKQTTSPRRGARMARKVGGSKGRRAKSARP